MPEHTLVIAEAACSWRFGDHLQNAYRSIHACKDCGADAWKTQWTSNPEKMAERRGMPANGPMYRQYLAYDPAWLNLFKAECDKVGIEFMVTVYLAEDISVIAPLVSRLKISAFESRDEEMKVAAHAATKRIIVSCNREQDAWDGSYSEPVGLDIDNIWCVSDYPTELEDLNLGLMLKGDPPVLVGLSDHTGEVLTGAVAVACGARFVESHVRLSDTPKDNPDYGHSLTCDTQRGIGVADGYREYVQNVRLAERML